MIILLVALFLVGCTTAADRVAQMVEGRDYWIDRPNRIIYTKDWERAQDICWTWGSARAWACYDPWSDVIVVPRGNAEALDHEWCHRHGWSHRDPVPQVCRDRPWRKAR